MSITPGLSHPHQRCLACNVRGNGSKRSYAIPGCHLEGAIFAQATGVSTEMPIRSAASDSQSPPEVRSKVASGSDPEPEEAKGFVESLLRPVQSLAKRAAVYVAFIAAKQPSRIRQVLQQVWLVAEKSACPPKLERAA